MTNDSNQIKNLILQVYNDNKEDILSSNYCLNKPLSISEKIKPSFYGNAFIKKLKKNLQTKDTLHLKKQINFFKTFKITTDIINDKKIIDQNIILKNNYFLDEYCSISRPIFNVSYNKALVIILKTTFSKTNNSTVTKQLKGKKMVYQFTDGKWELLFTPEYTNEFLGLPLKKQLND